MNNISNILRSTIKCSVFILLLLALIQPFGIETMKEGRIVFILAETALAFISVFIASYIASLMYETQATTKSFIIGKVLGNIINIPLLGAMLLSFNSWWYAGGVSAYWFYDGHFTLYPLGIMCLYVAMISVFVVLFEYFDFRNDRLRQELEEIKSINALLEQRQEALQKEEEIAEQQQTDESAPSAPVLPATITIVGQGMGAVLEVEPKNIIYVESMANYASICYIADNETKIATLRITLKQIRETLEGADCIVQCHRAFLVNINFVISLTNRNSSYQLQMFGLEKLIPVSRANTEVIKDRLKG